MLIRHGSAPRLSPTARKRATLIRAVRELLGTKNLTLYKAAALTRMRFPNQPARHIRPNFYSQLRSGLSPTFEQLIALSGVTGYRVRDWLLVFGFSLDMIPRLEALMSRPGTGLIDHDLAGPETLLPFLRYRPGHGTAAATTPLSLILEQPGPKAAFSPLPAIPGTFLYAKIGARDALSFPELSLGSIVRADTRVQASLLPRRVGEASRHYFLVENNQGIHCTRLRVIGPNRFAFTASKLSFTETQLELGTASRILGFVDLEFRFRSSTSRQPTPNKQIVAALSGPGESARSTPIEAPITSQRPGPLLRRARLHAGLSFRCASKRSREIAQFLGDTRYFASPGTLSDYEAGDMLPRHIHKLFTLSILYSLGFRALLSSFGLTLDLTGSPATGSETFPSQDTSSHHTPITDEEQKDSFFDALQSQFGELPLFLWGALPELAGLSRLSLRDVFWVGREPKLLHPSLRGALFLLVNHRKKKPSSSLELALSEQPLYLLQDRDGSYLASSCGIERGRLTVFTYPDSTAHTQPLRQHVDAEVVGEIVGVARSLSSPP